MLPTSFRRVWRHLVRHLHDFFWRHQKVENGLWRESHRKKFQCLHAWLCLPFCRNQIIRNSNLIFRLSKKCKSESSNSANSKNGMTTIIWEKLLKPFLAASSKKKPTATPNSTKSTILSRIRPKKIETNFFFYQPINKIISFDLQISFSWYWQKSKKPMMFR